MERELFAQSYWHEGRSKFAVHGNCINLGRDTELQFLEKAYVFNSFEETVNCFSADFEV